MTSKSLSIATSRYFPPANLDSRPNGAQRPPLITGVPFISFGPYRLFPNLRRLEKFGLTVDLGSRAFDILCALTEHAGEIVTSRDLLTRAWGKVVVGEGSLRFAINVLRKALARDGGNTEYIKNIARRGYVFLVPVQSAVYEPSAANASVEPGKPPRRPTKFVGRSAEVQEIVEILRQTRFVTVVGPGGLGKSTVAAEVAYMLREQFDLVRYMDLEPIKNASLVASTVASALGLVVSMADPISCLLAYLRDKRVLLVLDSCEHVLEATAMMVEQMLECSDQSAVVATSQEALRADGEHAFMLGPLRFPAETAHVTANEATQYSAVELFVSRARETMTHFQLTAANVAVVTAICRRVDGIPLAIELAAGRAHTLSLPTILTFLNSQFSLTWPGRRTAPERHRTLGAAIAWTVELLDESQLSLLRRIAVFSGPFSLEAAQQIVSGNNLPMAAVAGALCSLVGKSLLCSAGPEQSTDAESLKQSTHFWLLGATHTYATQLLEKSGESDWLAQRHARYLCELLESTYAGLSDLAHSQEWPTRAGCLTNIRSALEWVLAHQGGSELLLRLAAAASAFLLDLSLLNECTRWATVGLRALRDRRGSHQELELQASLGLSLMFSGGNVDEVKIALTRALELADKQHDHFNQVRLLAALNTFYQREGDYRSALYQAERARVVADSLEDPAFASLADWLLASSSHLAGDHATARRLGQRAWFSPPTRSASKRARFGFDDQRIRALCAWARSLWLLGKADQAREAVPLVLHEAELFGHSTALALAFAGLTPVWFWLGDLSAAADYLSRFAAHSEQNPSGIYQSVAYALEGQLVVERGQATRGLEILLEATAIIRPTRFRLFEIIYAPSLARALSELERIDEALAVVDAALGADEREGGSFILPELLRTKGMLLGTHTPGRQMEALLLLHDSFNRARQQDALSGELRAAMSLVRLDPSSQASAALLKQTYARFTEGFASQDLVLARTLLDASPP